MKESRALFFNINIYVWKSGPGDVTFLTMLALCRWGKEATRKREIGILYSSRLQFHMCPPFVP